MSSAARRRLVRDFRRLQNDPPQGVTGAPMDSNILVSSARARSTGQGCSLSHARGPPVFAVVATGLAGGHLGARRHAMGGRDVQASARILRGLSEQGAERSVPHQNVPPEHLQRRPDLSGWVRPPHPRLAPSALAVLIPGRALSRRADILQNQWSPIYDISAILTSIQSLLSDPNPASPANSEASRLYSENRREYNRRVREIVENSWLDDTAEEDVAESYRRRRTRAPWPGDRPLRSAKWPPRAENRRQRSRGAWVFLPARDREERAAVCTPPGARDRA